MSKTQLLYTIDSFNRAGAVEIAEILGMTYSAAAMALLRIVRQDLAARYIDPDNQHFVYELTPKGEARLDYFLEDVFNDR